jgi:hypothetical protein
MDSGGCRDDIETDGGIAESMVLIVLCGKG